MRFSTYDMKYAAKYIADHLDYRDCFDEKFLITSQRTIATKIYERLTHIEAQFPKEDVITICKDSKHFKSFFESLEKENIYYPVNSFNLVYQLNAESKNRIFRSPKVHVEQTRFNKKMTLITESLESYADHQDGYEFEDNTDCSINTSDYNDEEENRVFLINPSASFQVEIDTDTQTYFDELSLITNHVFLTGGKVIDLIKKEDKSTDRDYVMTPASASEIGHLGYTRDRLLNKKRKNYYKKEPHLIDVCMVDYIATHEHNWMFANAVKRDFTICMAFVKRSGDVYDPTGCALPDIKNNILRFYDEDAVAKLYEDPSRIIRAMKYIERGYEPDKKLDFALRFFDSLESKHKNHLYSVTRKVLQNSTAEQKNQLISNLDKYGQLKTLFGLRLYSPIEETVKALENLVKKQKKSTYQFQAYNKNVPEIGFSDYFLAKIKPVPESKVHTIGSQSQKHYRAF